MRTDLEIAGDVAIATRLDGTGPDDRVTFAVWDGLITLEGAMQWRSRRDAIEACARNVPGVRGVMNNIVIRLRNEEVAPAAGG